MGADSLADCVPCDLGTFSEAVGAISNATCSPCGQGKYANATGTASELQCYRCPMVRTGASVLAGEAVC